MHLNDIVIVKFSYVLYVILHVLFFISSDYARDKNNFARMPRALRPHGDCTRKHTKVILTPCFFVSLIALYIGRRSNTGIVVSDLAQCILTLTVYVACIGDPKMHTTFTSNNYGRK
jgi:hypothetical protein